MSFLKLLYFDYERFFSGKHYTILDMQLIFVVMMVSWMQVRIMDSMDDVLFSGGRLDL